MTDPSLSNSLTDLATRIVAEHDQVRAAMQHGLAHAVAAGSLLIEAKRQTDHGDWLDWLRNQCGITGRTAQAFMRAAREMPKLEPAKAQRVADLSFRQAMNVMAAEPRVAAKIQAVDEAAAQDRERFGKLLDDVERTGRVEGVYRRLSNMQQADRIRAAPPVLPTGPFPVIVADWPSAYEVRQADPTQRGILTYPTMSFEQICSLPVAQFAADDGALWVWTNNLLLANDTAAKVIEAWGCKPITILSWDKVHFVTGDRLRGVTEHVVLATRGAPLIDGSATSTLYREPRHGEHSHKPDGFYDLVRRICPAPRGGYCELFARKLRPGWVTWGDEVPRQEAAE